MMEMQPFEPAFQTSFHRWYIWALLPAFLLNCSMIIDRNSHSPSRVTFAVIAIR